MFVADAVADPVAGLAAAAMAAELLVDERASAVEVPLSRAAAWAQRRSIDVPVEPVGDGWVVALGGEPVAVASPTVTRSRGEAVPLDAHGAALRAEFSER
jgi:hypothetical protein